MSVFPIIVSTLKGQPALDVLIIANSPDSVFANQVHPDQKLFTAFVLNSCLKFSKSPRWFVIALARSPVGVLLSFAGRREFQ